MIPSVGRWLFCREISVHKTFRVATRVGGEAWGWTSLSLFLSPGLSFLRLFPSVLLASVPSFPGSPSKDKRRGELHSRIPERVITFYRKVELWLFCFVFNEGLATFVSLLAASVSKKNIGILPKIRGGDPRTKFCSVAISNQTVQSVPSNASERMHRRADPEVPNIGELKPTGGSALPPVLQGECVATDPRCVPSSCKFSEKRKSN